MAKDEEKKPALDRDNLDKSKERQEKNEPKRQRPAKKFGSGSVDEDDPGQRR